MIFRILLSLVVLSLQVPSTTSFGSTQIHGQAHRVTSLEKTKKKNIGHTFPEDTSLCNDLTNTQKESYCQPTFRPRDGDDDTKFHKKLAYSSVGLFSSRSSSDVPEKEKKNSFLRQILKLLYFPIKWLIVRPLKYIVELVTDDLDLGDGSAVVNGDDKRPPPLPTEENSTANEKPSPSLSSQENDDIPQTAESVMMEPNSQTQSDKTSDTKVERADDTIESSMVDTVTDTKESSPEKTQNSSKSETETPSQPISSMPTGDRWAVAAPGVDLTGEWELIVTEDFKQDYDRYLTELRQPLLVRSVALGIIPLTTEVTQQMDNGKSLLIRGQNVRGTWDRTLVASGTEPGVDDYTPLQIPVMSADSEKVEAESWWEDDGTVHVSWLRGVQKYGGGAFESRRYLDGDTYVCESTFHPDDKSKEPNRIVWRFQRKANAEK